MSDPKPIVVHIRALGACAVLWAIACGWSWMFPFSTLYFQRVDEERVDCDVEKHLLGFIAFEQLHLSGVKRVTLSEEAAARRATGGLYRLDLENVDGNHIQVVASSYSDSVVDQAEEFLGDASRNELRLWVMSFFGYATALVAVPAVLLTIAVVWDLIVNRIAWLTHAPDKFVAEQNANRDANSRNAER